MARAALVLALAFATAACDPYGSSSRPPEPTPEDPALLSDPGPPAWSETSAPGPGPGPAAMPAPDVDTPDHSWQERMNLGVANFKTEDQAAYLKILTLMPRRGSDGQPTLQGREVEDPRAAHVLLSRLLDEKTTPATRRAIAEALPRTSGDWQDGASHIVRTEAEALVRKALVESMRYARYPHSIRGLRHGLRDEDPRVRAAAVRTAGVTGDGKVLWSELVSALFDEDAEIRASAAHSLGLLRVTEAWSALQRVLDDKHHKVRYEALKALDTIDHGRAKTLPELDKLSRDRGRQTAALASSLLGRRAPKKKKQRTRAAPAAGTVEAPSAGTQGGATTSSAAGGAQPGLAAPPGAGGAPAPTPSTPR